MEQLEYIIRIKINDSSLSEFISLPLYSLKEFELSCIQQVLDYFEMADPSLRSYTSSIEHDYVSDIDHYALLIYASIHFEGLYRMYLTDKDKSLRFIDSQQINNDIELNGITISVLNHLKQ